MYNFTIDTTKVQVISSDAFDSYTFNVEREEAEVNVLENYVITIFNNGNYAQMLLTYPYVIENGEILYDFENAIAEYIFDDSLLLGKSGSPCPSTSEEIIAWEDGGCIAVNCGLEGNHSPGEACDDGEVRAHWNCGGAWVVTGCVYTGGGTYTGGTDPSNNTTNGGGNSNDTNNIPNEEIPVIPFEDLKTGAECKKIKDFLEENSNNEFLLNLKDLKNHTSKAFERLAIKFVNINTVGVQNGTPQAPEVKIPNLPLGINVEVMAHTHYENPNTSEKDTYSVFSLDDIQGMAQLLKTNHADNTLISFLATGKGTYYALTINDSEKLSNFFYYILNKDNPPTDPVAILKWSDSKKKYKQIKKKYYENLTTPITINNVNNNAVLASFLLMLSEADMGVSMFKTDENFDTFEKVTFDASAPNLIKPTPCN